MNLNFKIGGVKQIFYLFQIIFHLEYLPQGDQVHYHQWWDDIVHDYPFLYVDQIDQSELDICHGPTEQRIRLGKESNMFTVVNFCFEHIHGIFINRKGRLYF